MTTPANLILFQSDNHAGQLAGCYGHPLVRTPAMDRIATAGVRFASAYCSSPLCCPSRSSLATGRFPHQTGYWDNALTYDGRIPTWHHRLREQGHTVTAVGKLHYRSGEDDNGFTEEIIPMHLHEGKGAIKNLLRGYGSEPPKDDGSFWKLYIERSGVGATHYQDYDRNITREAVAWLKKHARGSGKPWVLYVSYISAHPPFTVPQELWDLYPEKDMPLPPAFRPGERPEHPAMEFLRHMDGMRVMTDEAALRRIAAGYFALITHLDRQIGEVMKDAEELGLLGNTRIAYTSDHGELFGAQGLFGKKNLYEGAIRVPLLLAGPGVPQGRVVRQFASHVDLFPTIAAAVGARLDAADDDLPGIDLWPAIGGREIRRPAFAEYHAQASKAGAFVLRDGAKKLIYHVGMPPQLFDLERDPDEMRDLAATEPETVQALEEKLRTICDPEAADARAKADQRAAADAWGGAEALLGESQILFTPPPGVSKEEAWKIPGPSRG
ncbi:MAG: sulfatase-like hydrolase/transferase [Burkholderiales bacterium]|nr:sulfatase-like hydrolase/transferase [Burkholderiales bacterium]